MKNKTFIIVIISIALMIVTFVLDGIVNGDFIFWIEKEETYDVLLDPGHGGYDPGCVFNEYQEKDFNLKMAKKVKVLLENQGLSVKLTREEDEIPWAHDQNSDLRGRVAQSVAHDPILFVSMHINSSPNPQGNGFEIYANELRSLSKEAAQNVYNQVMDLNLFKDRGVFTSLKKSLFVIDMNTSAAILIETGFLSNEYDRSILLNDQYLNNICEKIANGIYQSVIASDAYQNRHPS